MASTLIATVVINPYRCIVQFYRIYHGTIDVIGIVAGALACAVHGMLQTISQLLGNAIRGCTYMALLAAVIRVGLEEATSIDVVAHSRI